MGCTNQKIDQKKQLLNQIPLPLKDEIIYPIIHTEVSEKGCGYTFHITQNFESFENKSLEI